MIKFRFEPVLLSHWRNVEMPQYLAMFNALEREAAEMRDDDDVTVSLVERQGDSLLRAVIRRSKPTMVWSDWTEESGDAHYVYRRPFNPGTESPQEVFESCRRMVTAPLLGTPPDQQAAYFAGLH